MAVYLNNHKATKMLVERLDTTAEAGNPTVNLSTCQPYSP